MNVRVDTGADVSCLFLPVEHTQGWDLNPPSGYYALADGHRRRWLASATIRLPFDGGPSVPACIGAGDRPLLLLGNDFIEGNDVTIKSKQAYFLRKSSTVTLPTQLMAWLCVPSCSPSRGVGRETRPDCVVHQVTDNPKHPFRVVIDTSLDRSYLFAPATCSIVG